MRVIAGPEAEANATTVARYLADALPSFGVTHVFELAGGMIATLLDELHQQPALRVVSVLHEQAAGFAAEGFARISGRPAVALATSGPGATNLLTAVGSCYFDSVPVVFITGQVNRAEIHAPGHGRQLGFQETDIVSMAAPVTKGAQRVDAADAFPEALAWAFAVATSGRPGPVLLDIPMDIQRETLSAPMAPGAFDHPDEPTADDATCSEFVTRLVDALARSERPLVIAGGGIRSAGAVDLFRGLVDGWRLPVVTSLMGIDAIPGQSPRRVGFLGSYGNRWANWAVGEADLLLVLGSRLDIRQTGSDVPGFRGSREIFHVDVDQGELNNRVPGCVVVHDDLRHLLQKLSTMDVDVRDAWTRWEIELAAAERRWPDTAENVPTGGVNPNAAVRRMGEMWPDVASVITDVGQHQMWAAQSIRLGPGQRFLTSGGMGSMGFGLPAALGAALSRPGEPVALVAGDGGFQCNIQELQTVARLGLPIRMVVMNNEGHGMVRQFQESYFDGRYFSTRWGYRAPSFVRIAEAYGLAGHGASSDAELDAALLAVRSAPLQPALIELRIDPDLNAYPKMAFGERFGSMEPAVRSVLMEGT